MRPSIAGADDDEDRFHDRRARPARRASRKGFRTIATALIAIEVLGAALIWLGGFDGRSLPVTALKALFIWAALAGASKRLHDIGLSAWWIPASSRCNSSGTTVLVVAMFVSFGISNRCSRTRKATE